MRAFELERANAQLLPSSLAADQRGACDCIDVRSPVSGTILRILRKSAGVVAAGEPLVEIGDPARLEVVVELLSSDAVRVEAGQRVLVRAWGGDDALEGVVRRVEPFGFTKVSALGIEEQRVNVVIDFTGPRESWARLGHGYRVETDIVLWEGDDVPRVPLGALFRYDGQWHVFTTEDGIARRRLVEIGHRNDFHAELVSGLDVGTAVVLHPPERLTDGAGIVQRPN